MMANQNEGAKQSKELNDQKTPRLNLAQFLLVANGECLQCEIMALPVAAIKESA